MSSVENWTKRDEWELSVLANDHSTTVIVHRANDHSTPVILHRANNRPLLYKLNVLASARVVCSIMGCKCEVEPIKNCILES
jgi:hypothetical protein